MSLADNQAAIRDAVESGLVAGAVTLVWHRGKVLQVNEIGRRDIEADLPMQRDTIFRVASMTKPAPPPSRRSSPSVSPPVRSLS